jgi:hypothetical protein
MSTTPSDPRTHPAPAVRPVRLLPPNHCPGFGVSSPRPAERGVGQGEGSSEPSVAPLPRTNPPLRGGLPERTHRPARTSPNQPDTSSVGLRSGPIVRAASPNEPSRVRFARDPRPGPPRTNPPPRGRLPERTQPGSFRAPTDPATRASRAHQCRPRTNPACVSMRPVPDRSPAGRSRVLPERTHRRGATSPNEPGMRFVGLCYGTFTRPPVARRPRTNPAGFVSRLGRPRARS